MPAKYPQSIRNHIPAMIDLLRAYDDLRKEIHEALRTQHPEWIQPNGESPICDAYEARLAELLDFFADSSFGSIQRYECTSSPGTNSTKS
jgi:hypothetical protein